MVQKISDNFMKSRQNLVSERNNIRIEFLQLYVINPQMLTSHWLESYTFIDFCDVIIFGQCFIGQWLLSGQILVLYTLELSGSGLRKQG